MRFAAVAVPIVTAGLLASCSAAHVRPAAHPRAGTRQAVMRGPAHVRAAGGTRLQVARGPWWSQGPVTPCGAPALVRAGGHVLGVGCGRFASPPLKVTLTIGQRIGVHMMLGALPHSSRPAVLAPGAATGTTQTYRADGTGQAVLSSDSRACRIFRHRQAWQARQATTRTCPVATATVVP